MSDLGNENTRIKKISVKDYNLKELSVIYCVSKYILRKRMKRYKEQIGQPDGNSCTVKQVSLIFTLLDLPSHILVVKA